MNINKIQSTQNNNNKGNNNILVVKCRLSGQQIHDKKAICLNIKNNNTTYVSEKYLSHSIFNNLNISKSFKIDMLTLAYLGATLNLNYTSNNNYILSSYKFAYTSNNLPTYIIELKNGLQINIYDNDASSKKFFNILKNYKTSIATIKFFSIATTDFSHYIPVNNFMEIYPPYAKKYYEWSKGIGYNPESKKTTIKFW